MISSPFWDEQFEWIQTLQFSKRCWKSTEAQKCTLIFEKFPVFACNAQKMGTDVLSRFTDPPLNGLDFHCRLTLKSNHPHPDWLLKSRVKLGKGRLRFFGIVCVWGWNFFFSSRMPWPNSKQKLQVGIWLSRLQVSRWVGEFFVRALFGFAKPTFPNSPHPLGRFPHLKFGFQVWVYNLGKTAGIFCHRSDFVGFSSIEKSVWTKKLKSAPSLSQLFFEPPAQEEMGKGTLGLIFRKGVLCGREWYARFPHIFGLSSTHISLSPQVCKAVLFLSSQSSSRLHCLARTAPVPLDFCCWHVRHRKLDVADVPWPRAQPPDSFAEGIVLGPKSPCSQS